MNQREKIVFYIQKFGSISTMEAFQDLELQDCQHEYMS